MMEAPLIVAIIVNWNRKELLSEAISSLVEDGYSNIKIVVVDNASADDSIEMVRSIWPDVFIIENAQNLGYSKGNNQGIEVAHQLGADFLLFLNNDATIKPGCLTELISIFKADPECGAASPFIVYADKPDLIWFGGGEVSLWNGRVSHKHIRTKFIPVLYHTETTEYITGCALLVRGIAIREIGGFDERFTLYNEDVDLCLRFRKAGWSLKVTPLALALHQVSASTGGGLSPLKAFYRARSTAILMKKWIPWWVWGILPIAGFVGLLIVSIGLILKRQASIAKALWQGVINGFTNSSIPPAFRLDFK